MIDKSSHLRQRLLFSAIAIVIITIALYFAYSPALYLVLMALITATVSFALWEYYHITKIKGLAPAHYLGIIGSAAYLMAVFFYAKRDVYTILPEAIVLAWFVSIFLYYFFSESKPLANLAITVFGFVYITIPLSFFINIIYFPFHDPLQDGRWWCVYLVLVTKMTDIGGYFIGKMMGKRKLAPIISPKKTLEGAIGGVIFAVVASMLMFFAAHHAMDHIPFKVTFTESIWLGILVGLLSLLGDLSESLLKRDGGVKDSNNLPGVGGILDVVDSLIFTTPALYLFMKATQ